MQWGKKQLDNVISFERGKNLKTGNSARHSLCPLCDQPTLPSASDGFLFVCENAQHTSFTWTERAHDGFGMVRD
jgi:hypothetical protein